jgi:hypothetical protein
MHAETRFRGELLSESRTGTSAPLLSIHNPKSLKVRWGDLDAGTERSGLVRKSG